MTVQQPAVGGAGQKARDARDHPALSWAARLGFLAYGVVYLVVAWLAGQLALGDGDGPVSGKGALHELAQQPLGSVALWVAAAGLAAVAVWEACQAVGGHRDRDGLKRLGSRAGSAGRAGVYAVLAVLSVQVVLGDSSGGSSTDSYTADLMRMPLGPWLVAGVGLVIVALGLNSVHKGFTDRWCREVEAQARSGDLGTMFTALARAGFVARGAAFGVIGGLFVWAGLTHDAQKSGGLDQALHRLREASYGPALLGAIAVGLACYGAFNVAKAWYLREH